MLTFLYHDRDRPVSVTVPSPFLRTPSPLRPPCVPRVKRSFSDPKRSLISIIVMLTFLYHDRDRPVSVTVPSPFLRTPSPLRPPCVPRVKRSFSDPKRSLISIIVMLTFLYHDRDRPVSVTVPSPFLRTPSPLRPPCVPRVKRSFSDPKRSLIYDA
jgi:hypothetical protein